ncbi:MAG: HEAT repeat domain-containing protein [Myxococcota bacterium]
MRDLGFSARRFLVFIGASLSACLCISVVAAQTERQHYMLNLLQSSNNFRVRAQAALALGTVERSDVAVRALTAALRDPHPSVRGSAATSLERLAAVSAVTALRARRRDPDAGARSAVIRALRSLEQIRSNSTGIEDSRIDSSNRRAARYYVGVGTPGTKIASLDSTTLQEARIYIEAQLAEMDEVVVAPPGESNAQVRRALRRNGLTGYFIDSSVVSIDESSEGTRASVSVILNTYPERDMRAMVSGRATVPGGTGDFARKLAMEGAIRGALRRLPSAMMVSAGR